MDCYSLNDVLTYADTLPCHRGRIELSKIVEHFTCNKNKIHKSGEVHYLLRPCKGAQWCD